MVSKKMNAQHLAYEYIRERILDGTYKGGMKIIEERLASEIGVSRTPIREAIKRLEQEGLIKNKQIYHPTAQDLIYMYELRIALESFAAQRAALTMSKESLEALGHTIKESLQLHSNSQSKNIYQSNQNFHELIIKESQNPILIDQLKKIQTIFYMFSLKLDLYNRPHLIEEHDEIYEAIKNRDAELARELMEQHLYKDMNFTLEIIGRKGQF